MTDRKEESVYLSIVIPAYLEEENLRLLLPRLNQVLTGLNCEFEILVIDTMEPLDKTQNACVKNNVQYIPRENGNSYGDAVKTGIARALGKYIVFMDADGSHTPEFLPNLYEHREGFDIVIASRYVKGGYTENPLPLIYMSKILNIFYAVVLNLKCHDVSNSFKLYRGELLKDLNLRCDNFDIVEEILIKIKRKKKDLSFKEVPFTFKKRMFGQTKRNLGLFIVTYLFTLLRLRFGK